MAGLIGEDYTWASALGGGVEGFAKGLMQAEDIIDRREERKFKRMEWEAKQKTEEADREKKKLEYEADRAWKERQLRAGMRERGFLVAPEGQDFDPSQAKVDPEWVQTQERLRSVGAAADPYGIKAATAAEAAEKARKRNISPVPGYEKTDQYVGSPTEEQGLRSGFAKTQDLKASLGNLQKMVSDAYAKDPIKARIDLANPYSDLSKALAPELRKAQLLYKAPEFTSLGVLTGPDLALLEQIIENPGSISNLIQGSAVADRYGNLVKSLDSGLENKATALGLRPAQGGLLGEKPGLLNRGMLPKSAPGEMTLEQKRKRLEELERKARGG